MVRKDAVSVEVDSPSTGLVTRFPSNLSGRKLKGALLAATNVRAEDKVLHNAPGYERIALSAGVDVINKIHQANLVNISREAQGSVFVGTATRMYTLSRRAKELICPLRCSLRLAVVGDCGSVGSPAADVAELVRSWLPDVVVQLGDLTYNDGSINSSLGNPIDQIAGQYYWRYIGGYSGKYGSNAGPNRFFATPGNHDWTDFGIDYWYDFFQLPGNERYYALKRGPMHLILVSSADSEPSGRAVGSDQYAWAAAQLAGSDCAWPIVLTHTAPYTSDINHGPGDLSMRWDFAGLGAKLVISGHAHQYERLAVAGFPYIVNGLGGQGIRDFATILPESLVRYNADFGALLIDADFDQLVSKFYNRSGQLVDTLTLTNPKAASVCYLSSAGSAVTSLQVVPGSALIEVGQAWQFRAYATHVDGAVTDVTEEASWGAADPAIITMTGGLVTGQASGSSGVTAQYGGQSDSAEVTVQVPCTDSPREFVLVICRSESMLSAVGTSSRLQVLQSAVQSFLDTVNANDRVAVVSFGGDLDTQIEDVSVDIGLTTDLGTVSSVVSSLAPGGYRSISGALDAAKDLLDGSSRPDAERIVVLLTDGPANVKAGTPLTDPSLFTGLAQDASSVSAGALRSSGAYVVVVAYNVESSYSTVMHDWATTGYFKDCLNAEELAFAVSTLPNSLCKFGDVYYLAADSNTRLDYFGFVNWDVINGVVDLCGIDSHGRELYNVLPGHGMYVDMCGTDPLKAHGAKSFEGTMRSKSSFSFEAGKVYQLSLKVAGPNRGGSSGTYQVQISLGDDASTVISVDASQGFTTFYLDLLPSVTSSRKVTIRQLPIPGGLSTQGCFIDDVLLTNVTDAVTMLEDIFDTENPGDPISLGMSLL